MNLLQKGPNRDKVQQTGQCLEVYVHQQGTINSINAMLQVNFYEV